MHSYIKESGKCVALYSSGNNYNINASWGCGVHWEMHPGDIKLGRSS